MSTKLQLALLLGAIILFCKCAAQCVPGNNCKPPDCRCANDKTIPGNLPKADTPQIILVSFAYAVNGGNEGMYASIFENIKNPNGCPAKGTFFVQELSTDFDVIKTLHDRKHEIGITTEDGTTPTSAAEWLNAFQKVKSDLETAGIPADEILGCRAPELFVGGDNQFVAVKALGLEYDSSCVSQDNTTPETMLWPFTYDFVDSSTPVCSIGNDPQTPFQGKWQFLVADLKVGKQKCATPSACSPFINTTQEAFDLLYNAFADHYEGQRPPYVLYIDPLWLTVDFQMEATKQFLQFIRAGFDDTWVITNQQALAWIKDPTPSSKINDFVPWKC